MPANNRSLLPTLASASSTSTTLSASPSAHVGFVRVIIVSTLFALGLPWSRCGAYVT